MRKLVLALAITALAIPLMGTLEPAEARIRWSGGAEFSVGGIYFSLGFADNHRHGYGPGYFYRTNHALDHRGYQCGSACFISDGYGYHDRYCPLLQRHFSVFRFDAVNYWAGFNHVRFGYPGYRYGPWDRGYRYDRRHYWRHERRHDRRHDRRREWRDDRRDHRRDHRGGRYDRDDDSDRRGGRYDRNDRRGSDRRGGRYDRNDRRGSDRRGERYDRNDRRDSKRDKGKASRSRSRRRGN